MLGIINNRCYTLNCERFVLRLLTWDQAGPLEKSGGPSVENDRESDVESQHLQGCSPAYDG
jgi:hypothetical protein